MTAIADPLADDPTHSIPEVGVLDIRGVKMTGGADLVIVVASPLKNDERSRRRVVQKIRNYLGYLNSEDFAKEHGRPTPESATIIFQVHPESDPAVLAFLEECRVWIYENHAGLAVKKLANQPTEPTAKAAAHQ